jgi:hypothetical protein
MSALWFDATCRVEESGDMSPHSKLSISFAVGTASVNLPSSREKL